MNPIEITIISDNVCPFCYIGRKRLDRALALFRKTVPGASSVPVSIHWRPFLLDSDPPPASVSYRERAVAKFGSDRLAAKTAKLEQMGLTEGIKFTFDGRFGDTRDSHRLAVLGRTKGWQVEDKLVMEIMSMFFERGGDVSSWDDLVQAAERVGIRPEEARHWLETDGGGVEVDREVAEAVANEIHGVPKFVINGKYEVDGADDMFAFLESLSKAMGVVS